VAKRIPLPPQEYLRECFEYNPETGGLRWKERPRHHFVSDRNWNQTNSKSAGKIVGWQQKDKRNDYTCLRTQIDGIAYLVSRVIIKLVYDMEFEDVDHAKDSPLNNRLENLRPCTHAENGRNKRMSKTNVSGYKGVHYCQVRKGYVAQISIARKGTIIGPFATAEEAHTVYCELATRFHGEFARTT
jgi:hypothetical protein